MQYALVTGGAGFLGSHMCEALLNGGWSVTCVDNFSTGSRANIEHLGALRVLEGDVNQPDTWQGLASQPFDVVVHYAATVGVQRTLDDPMAVLADVAGMRHLAAFARAGGAKKIVFASSSEVYGHEGQVPMYEETAPVGWSPYTTVKLYGEYLFESVWRQYGIPTVSLRFFNVYGPRQVGNAYGFVVAKFIEQVLAGAPPTVYGDGSQTRDFVYVADNIRATLAVIESELANGQIANVGTGHETTVLELAHAVIAGAESGQQLVPIFLPARLVEVRRRCAAPAHLEKLCGARCNTSLQEGIGETLAWFQAHGVLAGEKVALR